MFSVKPNAYITRNVPMVAIVRGEALRPILVTDIHRRRFDVLDGADGSYNFV